MLYSRGAQPFRAKGRSVSFSAFEGERQNYEQNFLESSIKNRFVFFYITSSSNACGLILFPSELFRIVMSCKTDNSSTKFKYIQKISVIQEKFLVFFNLLRGPDITRPGVGSCPWAVHLCFTALVLRRKVSAFCMHDATVLMEI